MVIRTVDHSDAQVFTGELLRCLEATKSRSNNHNLRFFGRGVLHGTRMFAERKPMRGFIVVASLPPTQSRRNRKDSCLHRNQCYLSCPMPKPIARSKTRKAVAKRFKITARG